MGETKKKRKVVKILIVFLILILVATFIAYSYFQKTSENEKIKNEFYSMLAKNDISFFTTNDLYDNIGSRLQKTDYKVKSDISLSNTLSNSMFSNLDLSKFSFTYKLNSNQTENKSYGRLVSKYSGNTILILENIIDKDAMAIKSDEIVNRYVGVKKRHLEDVTDKFLDGKVKFAVIDKMKDYVLDREAIDINGLANEFQSDGYLKILEKNTPNKNFTKESNVVITADTEQIYTTKYTLTLNSSEFTVLLTELSKQLGDNDAIIEKLVTNKQDIEIDDENEISEDESSDENTVEVPAEQNNFNTSLQSQDTQNEIDSNTTNTSNTVETNNTVNTTNTQEIVLHQQTSEEQNSNNVAENQVAEQQGTEQVLQSQTETQPEQTQQQEEQTAQTENSGENTTTSENIIEDENLRMKGFVQVNDEQQSEKVSDEDKLLIGESYEETMQNISNLIKKIDWKTYLLTGAKANVSQTDLAEKIREVLTEQIKQNGSLVVNMYVSEDKIVKMTLEVPEMEESVDLQINSKKDNEKTLNFTTLTGKGDEANGYNFSLYKRKSDATLAQKISMNKISKNKIIQKMNLEIETNGTSNAKKYTNTINMSYSNADGEIKVKTDNQLSFENEAQIEDLNDENCLFLDSLSEEDFGFVKDEIKEKTLEVLKEKNKNLNMINLNNASSVVEQREDEQETNNNSEEDKEKVKQALIDKISNQMADLESRGRKMRLQDLEGLQIDGYEVDVSISSNLAIITINGYKFKLDSDFNLSDS